MTTKSKWKAFFWFNLLLALMEIYRATTTPEILQPAIPDWLSYINVVILPCWLFGLYAYAYSLNLPDYLFKCKFGQVVTALIFISAYLGAYFEYSAGGYLGREMFFIVLITTLYLMIHGYALINLTKTKRI